MANLVARGEEPQHQWLHELPPETVTLGSRPTESTWVVPWDKFISRVHATLTWREGKLFVRRHPRASNKIFFRSEALDEFALEVGEEFLIGSTSFSVQQSETNSVDVQPTPDVRFTCSAQELQLIEYTDADQRIEVLAALPGVIRYSPSDEELEARVVDVLLRGIPRASAAAVVWLDPAPLTDDPALKVRYWSNRGREQEGFRPSRLLVLDAVRRLRQRVMHIWHGGGINPEYTVPAGSWAICVPLADEPAPGWALYVTGMLGDQISGTGDPTSSNALKSDLKFVELVADIFGSLRQVRDLQGRQAHLSGFLSRPVLAALAEHDMDEVLMPRQTEVTVLFCDLRGSCRIAEEGQDELFGLWNRVGEALGVMTGSITAQDGVIGDFQGDAAMGFWGWPLTCDDQVERAARAALEIWRTFTNKAKQAKHPLAGFNCGIGIANGQAIAGQLGTPDQFKVGVYGPIVNLASRLESLTKFFRVPILLNDSAGRRLAACQIGPWARLRQLARIQPYGMRTTLMVSELMPPAFEPGTLSERDRRDYEAALEAFLSSRWDNARGLLDRLPRDGPSERIRAFMDRRQQIPPPQWNGVIAMDSK